MCIEKPDCYSTKQVEMIDMAYQAWLKGIIVDEKKGLDDSPVKPTVKDEYRFIRRHFNPVWAVFVLFLRIKELNNPISEVRGFISSLDTRRIDAYDKTRSRKRELDKFCSTMLARKPKVSVVIPTLNRYEYLKDALKDLEGQDYENFEVLVVDQSEPFDQAFYENYELDIKSWYQQEKALWLARNTAIERSGGELVLLFDDDSRVEKDWISRHIRCLDFFNAEISSGVSISVEGGKVPETYSYYKWSDQIDTGNVMIQKDVFRKIGLFDRQFEKQRQGDGEFGLRAYLAGFKNISNPDASRLHLKVESGGLRQMGSWDGWRPKKFFAPRPVPSVLYLSRKYFGNRAAVLSILQSVLPSIVPYRFKRNNKVMVLGTFLALGLFPFISISVVRSWRQASQMLNEGAKIPKFE